MTADNPKPPEKIPDVTEASSAALCSASVLDACCGSRLFWFDPADSRAIFMDKRTGAYPITRYSRPKAKAVIVNPDVIGDFAAMPFPDDTFLMVVFDPPHLSKIGDSSTMAKVYGKLVGDWKVTIADGFKECFRVLKPGGTLIFKWCEFEIPVVEVLALTPEKPLFGNKYGKRAKSHWMAFLKPNDAS
jgi:SAM-dependent methyltransferase